MAPLAPHLRDHYAIQAIPETCLPGEGASPFCGVLRVVAARRRLCRAAGPGASPHARLARQGEEQSGERRPEGAALNKYGKSNHVHGGFRRLPCDLALGPRTKGANSAPHW